MKTPFSVPRGCDERRINEKRRLEKRRKGEEQKRKERYIQQRTSFASFKEKNKRSKAYHCVLYNLTP